MLNTCARSAELKMCGFNLSGDVQDLIEGDVSAVLHVLHLFTVAFGLLQSFDYHGRSCGHNLNRGVTILADKLDSNVHALPCLGGLGDIVTNLLGRLRQIQSIKKGCASIKVRTGTNNKDAKDDQDRGATMPRGPIFGARDEPPGTSPPLTRRVTAITTIVH